MLEGVISGETKKDLEIIEKAGIVQNFYLAGGTGLAFQLRHRLSIDLDFFTRKDIDTKNFIQKLKGLGNLSVEKEAENSLICNFNETRVSFLKYDYPCLFNFIEILNVKVADSRDIGCMKIDAISSRGKKRDFIDLYFICKKVLSLDKLFKLFKRKYESVNYNLIHILKSLVYFEDAQKEPMPKMTVPISWEQVKKFFKSEISTIKTDNLNL